MAKGRPIKKGLEYFPLNVDLFSDIKVRKLIRRQGGKAMTVYVHLLCSIYRNGYYLEWDNDLPFIISEDTGYDEAYIQEAIKCCFAVGLFSKQIYDQHQVITSRGIQYRYQEITRLLKRAVIISEFNLINSEEIPINSEEKPIDSGLMQQKKGKEIKGNKIEENEENDLSFFVPNLSSVWYQNFPNQTPDEQNDFRAIGKIMDYIARRERDSSLRTDIPKASEHFRKLITRVKASEFYADKPLKTIANNMQNFDTDKPVKNNDTKSQFKFESISENNKRIEEKYRRVNA